MFIQFIEDDIRLHVSAQFDNDAHTLTVRFVAKCCDTIDDLITAQVRNRFDNASLVNLVWNLSHYDFMLALRHFFNGCTSAHFYAATTCGVRFFNAFPAQNERPCWEVWPFDLCHQFVHSYIWIIDEHFKTITYFVKVVRRNIGRHPYGDTARTIDEKIWDLRWQYGRFLQAFIIVRHEINSFLVDISEHFLRNFRHTYFGITHRSGTIAVDGTKVTVAVYQEVARIEILR